MNNFSPLMSNIDNVIKEFENFRKFVKDLETLKNKKYNNIVELMSDFIEIHNYFNNPKDKQKSNYAFINSDNIDYFTELVFNINYSNKIK